MSLANYIRDHRQRKPILLMSHAVLGYPSWEDNRYAIEALVHAGVELIELQFPFSEPIADGPTLLAANHKAVEAGTTIRDCFQFAAEITQQYPQTRFVIMTYANILFRYGVTEFVQRAAASGIAGCIIPDLPPELAVDYSNVSRAQSLATIFLVTPKNSLERLQQIVATATGMVYCVARKGVTGYPTPVFNSPASNPFYQYLQQVRAVTSLPMGVGFGIQAAADVHGLVGHVDIAVVGSQVVKYYADQGAQALTSFMQSLRLEH